MLAYPKGLEAVNTSEWEGWVQSPARTGSAIYSVDNIDSYLFAHPKATAAQTSGGGSTGVVIGVVVVAAIAVLGIVAVMMLRRRRRAVEE